jgi:dihydrodipicolinate synthase/N-acetylneuraminate lyase
MSDLRSHLLAGQVIPAHPLALTADRKLDERRQRALSRYYIAAGVGGLAVGVHTTQFAIRDPKHGLFEPVLTLAAEAAKSELARTGRKVALVAGAVGRTAQAVAEAETAARLGYDATLLSLAAWQDATDQQLLAHCRTVSGCFPLWLLSPAGSRWAPPRLPVLAQPGGMPGLVAIKIAPFSRYHTLEVVRAVADSGRQDVALYTGNDDSIVIDLLSRFPFGDGQRRIVGGLLGQWAVWARRAVELLQHLRRQDASNQVGPEWLALATRHTDANAAIFDADHQFAGCISGIHEVLRREGLLAGTWCLDPEERLSPGQADQISRISQAYPSSPTMRSSRSIATHGWPDPDTQLQVQ